MRTRFCTYGATFIAGLCAQLSFANGLDALRSFTKDLKALQGEFSQTTTDTQGKSNKALSGTFALTQGGKFRFNYAKPYTQVLVSDGKTFSTYDADLAQMTVRKLDESLAATPLAVLSGQAAVDTIFVLKALPDADGLTWVAATPKQADTAVNDLRFGLKGGELRSLSWLDNFNKRTVMNFSNVKRNGSVDAAVFSFKPPPGTDIVGNRP
jgi:outer membrane lipoprotein carrier protein